MYTRAVCAALVVASVSAFAVHYWPRELDIAVPKLNQIISHTEGQVRVYVPGQVLVGELSRFDDGLFAYLMFDYYRGRRSLRDSQLMLVSRRRRRHADLPHLRAFTFGFHCRRDPAGRD
jgi:hypothetical protein